MKFKLILLFGLLFFGDLTYGQSLSTLQITVLDKKTKEAVGNKDMTLLINDTLTKTVKLNDDGQAKAINLYGGYYKIQIKIDDYQTQTLKKVGVDEARGRILIVKMVPITNKH